MGFFDSIGDRYRKWQEERKAKAIEKQHRKRNSASNQQPPHLQHEHVTPAGPVSTRDRSASSPHVSHSHTPLALPPLDEAVHYPPQLHIEHPASSPYAPQSSAHRSPHSASPSSSSSSQVAARNTGGPRAAAATQLRSASPTNVSSQLSTPYRAHPSGLASVGLGSSPISHSGAVGSHSSMNQQGLSAHATPHRPLPSGASSSAGPSSQQRSSHPRYAESKEDDIGELDGDLDHLHVSRRGPPTASPASASKSNDSAQPATKQDDDEQFALMLQQQEYMSFLEESGELNARDADTLHAIEAARRAKEERRQRRRERRAAEQAAATMSSGNGTVGSASVHLDVPHTPSPALEEDERQFFASIQSRAHAALEQQQQQQQYQPRHRSHAANPAVDQSSSERLLRSMGFISASASPSPAANAEPSLRLPHISSGSSSSSSSANASAIARNRSYSHAQPAPSHLPSFPSLVPHSHSHSHSLNPSSAFLSRSASLSNASAAPASAPLTRAASLSRAEISVLPTFLYVPSPSKSQTKVTQETTTAVQISTDNTTGATVTETVTSSVTTAAVSVPDSPEDESCSICLGEFEFNEKLRALPCLHKYHAACVDDWLSRSSHCPNCNTDVRAAFG